MLQKILMPLRVDSVEKVSDCRAVAELSTTPVHSMVVQQRWEWRLACLDLVLPVAACREQKGKKSYKRL